MTDLVHLAAGGALIGAGTALLVLANGRIAGVSGAFGHLLDGDAGPGRWRLGFLIGLLLPAAWLATHGGGAVPGGSLGWLAVSGLLVGIGTRVANGCTSGHGVAGNANFSRRSQIATLLFMGAAMVTVFVVRHVLPAGAGG